MRLSSWRFAREHVCVFTCRPVSTFAWPHSASVQRHRSRAAACRRTPWTMPHRGRRYATLRKRTHSASCDRRARTAGPLPAGAAVCARRSGRQHRQSAKCGPRRTDHSAFRPGPLSADPGAGRSQRARFVLSPAGKPPCNLPQRLGYRERGPANLSRRSGEGYAHSVSVESWNHDGPCRKSSAPLTTGPSGSLET